jgi:hypothetical protein
MGDNVLEQFAAFGKFHNYVNVILRLEYIPHFDDVRMMQQLEESDFPLDSCGLTGILDVLLVDDLDCNLDQMAVLSPCSLNSGRALLFRTILARLF